MKKSLETSLGYQLYKNQSNWEINLSDLKVFRGLSILARVIGDSIIEQAESGLGDISFTHKISSSMTPELLDLDIEFIQIYAKSNVLENIHTYKLEFHDHLRSVFGTFQRPKWGSLIHPEYFNKLNDSISKALIFPFHHVSQNKNVDYIFILERSNVKKSPGKFFFRLTIEDQEEATYHLKSIPYTMVDDLKYRVFIEGSTKMAESFNEKIQSYCTKGLVEYTEENLISSHVFEQIFKTGIGSLDQFNILWDDKFSKFMIETNHDERLLFIKKIFLSFEDNTLTQILRKGETVRLVVNSFIVNLYLTRLNKVLNISINKDRKTFSLDYYLKRMPLLEEVALQKSHNFDFNETRIFLIHHITSEILALIELFRKLNTDKLQVMFVKYGGVIPSSYLDVLLDIADENFFATGLSRTTTPLKQEYFVLSHLYGDISLHKRLADYLEDKKLNFFEAMKTLSAYFFFKFCEKAKQDKKKVLLVEDGGYLAPILNEFCLTNTKTKEVFQQFCLESDNNSLLKEWLSDVLIGTIEHTRNGYDRLLNVKEKFTTLTFPTYSIAVSKNKVEEESQEVAHSILSAIESILHGQGMILSRRKSIILGSAGNIGNFLSSFMVNGRLHSTNKELIKVDIKYSEINKKDNCYSNLSEIPRKLFLDRELFIGVIGKSIINQEIFEDLLLNGTATKLIFASGSTKTVEFSEIRNCLNEWSLQENANIQGIPIQLIFERIIDPQSKADQGGLVKIIFEKDSEKKSKQLYLLGDLSPINFLFYGVPTETMDRIIRQLTTASLGMVSHFRNNSMKKPDLYAVDKEVDEWGNFLNE